LMDFKVPPLPPGVLTFLDTHHKTLSLHFCAD
jgi:hypothetical protein